MPMTEKMKKFIELEKKKEEVKQYFDNLELATKELAEEIGIGGHFQDDEGTVYRLTIPEGRFVKFEKIGYERTRRPHEKRGSLSLKQAQELGYDVE